MKSPFIVLLILGMFLTTQSCCTTKMSTTSEISENTGHFELNKVHVRDSIFVNSVDTVKIIQKGDTIFNDVVRWRIQYIEKILSDTLIVHDTIYVKEYVYVEKEKERKRLTPIWLSALIMIAVLASCIVVIRKISRRWTGFL